MHDEASRELLTVRGLGTGYRSAQVLYGIDLFVSGGRFVGLLGANGSGKSTLLRAITGQIPLWEGNVTISGADLLIAPEQAKARFGYAVDPADLPVALTGSQYLELVASIKHCAPTDWPTDDLLGLLSLQAWTNRRISEYSFGTKMKISIAAALLGCPPLLILDESLNGLDPIVSWRLKQLLRQLTASERHAVILSTHQLETVAGLCDTAVLLAEGRIAQHWDRGELDRAQSRDGGFEQEVMAALREPPETRNATAAIC
jgi:ABC-2 type transport system ATP-binding protein